MIIRTTALGATDHQPYRVRARSGDAVLTEPFTMAGDDRSVPDTHERTARALARSVLGDQAFTIVQTQERVTGYTFRVIPG